MELESNYSEDTTSSGMPSGGSGYLSSVTDDRLPDATIATARMQHQMGVAFSGLRTSERQTGSIASSLIPQPGEVFSFVNEPDLTYYCGLCQTYINLTRMKDHKAFHWALTTLQYVDSRVPKDVAELATRRRFLIKLAVQQQQQKQQQQQQSGGGGVAGGVGESPRLSLINRINEAYELLKQDLEDTFEQFRRVDEKVAYVVSGRGLPCSLDAVLAVGACGSTNARWKSENEDASVYQDHFGNDPRKAFLAIYDGHSGRHAAALAANELHHDLLRRMREFDRDSRCVCAFNMLEQNDVSHFPGKRWPAANAAADAVAAEIAATDDAVIAGAAAPPAVVHRESANDIRQILYHCHEEDTSKAGDVGESVASGSDAYAKRMLHALRNAYAQTDLFLSYGKDEKSRVRWSGTSALTLVLADGGGRVRSDAGIGSDDQDVVAHIYLANAGNVQAVLVEDDGLKVVTKKHTGLNRKERLRVEAAGGFFSDSDRELRVNGVLACTRGLGNHGDPRLKRCTSSEPHLRHIRITKKAQFMILASNGVWEVFSPQEASDILLQFYDRIAKMLPANRIPTPGDVSPSILRLLHGKIEQAKRANSRLESSDSEAGLDADAAEDRDEPPRAILDKAKVKISGGSVHWEQSGHDGSAAGPENASDDFYSSGSQPEASRAKKSSKEEKALEIHDVAAKGWDAAPKTAAKMERYSQRELARDMAERLCQAALLAGSKDNITVMVVLFPAVRL